jgi:hypothetical protein
MSLHAGNLAVNGEHVGAKARTRPGSAWSDGADDSYPRQALAAPVRLNVMAQVRQEPGPAVDPFLHQATPSKDRNSAVTRWLDWRMKIATAPEHAPRLPCNRLAQNQVAAARHLAERCGTH